MEVRPWGPSDGQTATAVSRAEDANEEFRTYMEDGCCIQDPMQFRGRAQEQWGFFGVYDGHGGREEVAYCEAKLHEVVLAGLRILPGREVAEVLVAAFEKIDTQLAMLGAWDSGCTATVALVHRTGQTATLHVANVGDSRALVIGMSSTRRVTTDHRASDPAEARRVAQDGGMVRHGRVGGRLSVSRSLGDHHLKSCGVTCVPDVCSCDIGAEDRCLIIASDGLWDALSDDEARQVFDGCVERAVGSGGTSEQVAERLREDAAGALVERAKEQGSRDNILALVILFAVPAGAWPQPPAAVREAMPRGCAG